MKTYRFLVLFMGLLLTACGGSPAAALPTPTLLPPLPSSTATIVVLPTNTATPTATLTITPTTPAPPPATQIPPVATSGSGQQGIKIFLILIGDSGQSGTLVGCGDSVVPITVFIPATQGVLRAAMEKMLSAKQQFYGETGYYNALYQSNLQVASVTIEQGKAIIHLTGTLMLGGTCDAVSDVAVFINDVPLEDVLSQK
jgi:hypothetical protein